jgi:hypothetical protein
VRIEVSKAMGESWLYRMAHRFTNAFSSSSSGLISDITPAYSISDMKEGDLRYPMI